MTLYETTKASTIQLTDDERMQLIDEINPVGNAAINAVWMVELERRVAEIDSGLEQGVDGEVVHARVLQSLHARIC